MYFAGIIGLNASGSREVFISLIPFNLLVTSAILFSFHKPWNHRFAMVFLAVALTGWIAEWIGTSTGLLFGDYQYGEALGFKIASTPLLIGLNWVLLSYSIWNMLTFFQLRFPFRIIFAVILMVVLDILIEPVAMDTLMWTWKNDTVPLHNYVGWAGVSFIVFLIWSRYKDMEENPLAVPVILLQFLFFAVMNVFLIL
jgi:uncharacterized membrane protein